MSDEKDLQKKEVGSRIRLIRKELGLTMKEFGEKLNPPASDSIVSRWERGISLPNNDRLKKIAELGSVPTFYLLEGRKTYFIDETPFYADGFTKKELEEAQQTQKMIEEYFSKTEIELEDLFNIAPKITIGSKTLSPQEKEKALQILKLTFDSDNN